MITQAAEAALIHEPAAEDIDVHALHGGFLRGLRRRGGRLVTDAEVQALSREGGAWVAETRAGNDVGTTPEPESETRCEELSGAAAIAPCCEPPAKAAGFSTWIELKSLSKKLPV